MENIEELLTIDPHKMKKDDLIKLVTKTKQCIKMSKKEDTKAEEVAESYPYTAVSVVGNKYIEIKFDLTTGKGAITHTKVDSRDGERNNHMATYEATNALKKIAREQRIK